MANPLDLKVSLQALEDTTVEEVEAVARQLSGALAERSEVITLQPLMEPAPAGAKMGEAIALGAVVLAVAPAAVEGVLALIRDLLARMGTMPTKVTVERAGQKVTVEFDPRRTSVEDISALARTLAGQMDES